MWHPISISRLSLLALAAAGAGDRPPASSRHAFAKPKAEVAVAVDAPIYHDRVVDGAAVLRGFRDSALAVFRERYRYVAWSPTSGAAPVDTVLLRVVHPANSPDDVRIMLVMRGAHAGGDTVVATFESLDAVWDHDDWTTAAVVGRWAQRLRAITDQADVEVVHRVLVELPLDVQPTVGPAEATIPIGNADIENARDPNPEFKLQVTVVDTAPPRTEDPADLFLMKCRSGAGVYVCRAEKAVFLGDTIDGSDSIASQIGGPTRTIRPTSLHIWRYHPDTDPRTDGTLPGGTP